CLAFRHDSDGKYLSARTAAAATRGTHMFDKLAGVLAACALLAATASTSAQNPVKLRIMGMPLSTGNILKNREQPYFEKLGENVGFPIDADYKPLDSTGIKEFEQLRIMRQGLFDIIALRLGQVSRDEPTILGLD